MTTAKLREIEKVPDQAEVLAKMKAADHAAGRHVPPLGRCPDCQAGVQYDEQEIEHPVKGTDCLNSRIHVIKNGIAEMNCGCFVNVPGSTFDGRDGSIEAEPAARPAPKVHPKLTKLAQAPKRPTGKAIEAAFQPLIEAAKPKRSAKRPVPPVVEQAMMPDPPSLSEVLQADLEPLPWRLGPVTVTGEYATREAWLLAAVDAMAPWIEAAGSKVPPVRVSIGWPGGRGTKVGVRGQCWMASTVADGQPAIFITPDQHEPPTILAILLHELDHAVGNGGHRGEFAKLAGRLGLVKPWITASPDPDLATKLAALSERLGPFPHSKVNPGHGLLGAGPSRSPVRGTRMLKVQCAEHGYTVRMTRQWIDKGLPWCGMANDDADMHQMEEVTR